MTIFRDEVTALMPQLRLFARALTGRDPSLADDLVQDTIVNALQAQDRFTLGTNLKAWLFTILRNRYRSIMARRHVTAEVAAEGIEDLYWTGPEQDIRIEVAAFRRAFARLNVAHREVLVLICVNGLSYERTAEVLGCEMGTIKSRVNRARAQLKRLLLEDDEILPVAAAAAEVRPARVAPMSLGSQGQRVVGGRPRVAMPNEARPFATA